MCQSVSVYEGIGVRKLLCVDASAASVSKHFFPKAPAEGFFPKANYKIHLHNFYFFFVFYTIQLHHLLNITCITSSTLSSTSSTPSTLSSSTSSSTSTSLSSCTSLYAGEKLLPRTPTNNSYNFSIQELIQDLYNTQGKSYQEPLLKTPTKLLHLKFY